MNSAYEAFVGARDFLQSHRSDWARAVSGFRWPTLERFNWALDYFDVIAQGNTQPALWLVQEDGHEQRLSFAEMAQRSSQLANFLRSLGVQRGDRILLMLGNEPALWDTMLAAMKLGAVVIPTSVLLTETELQDRLDRGRVKHAVVAAAQCEKFERLGGTFTRIAVGASVAGWIDLANATSCPQAFEPDGPTAADDPMLLYFTSGTTSKPKLVVHTHRSYPVGHLSTMYWLGLRRGDVHLNISSPGWAKHAWSCFFAPWNAGACVFIHNQARFNAKACLDALARYGVHSFCAPPTVWRMLVQEDLVSYAGRVQLRELISAGEPLNPEIIEQVRAAWGLTVRDGFGQTEVTALVGNTPGQSVKPGSMGRPLPGYRVALLDVEGREAQEGEVCVALDPRPAGLMQHYEDSPAKTAEVMRDGYYHTGDVAVRDSEGYITFVGRADDVFKASDYRISPFELESVLIEHPAVMEAAVVPSPDPVRLAVPKAYVLLAPEAEAGLELARDIFQFTAAKLPPYKRLRRLEFVDVLPKTISGKIRRVELRSAEQSRGAQGRRSNEYWEDDLRAEAAAQ